MLTMIRFSKLKVHWTMLHNEYSNYLVIFHEALNLSSQFCKIELIFSKYVSAILHCEKRKETNFSKTLFYKVNA